MITYILQVKNIMGTWVDKCTFHPEYYSEDGLRDMLEEEHNRTKKQYSSVRVIKRDITEEVIIE